MVNEKAQEYSPAWKLNNPRYFGAPNEKFHFIQVCLFNSVLNPLSSVLTK